MDWDKNCYELSEIITTYLAKIANISSLNNGLILGSTKSIT